MLFFNQIYFFGSLQEGDNYWLRFFDDGWWFCQLWLILKLSNLLLLLLQLRMQDLSLSFQRLDLLIKFKVELSIVNSAVCCKVTFNLGYFLRVRFRLSNLDRLGKIMTDGSPWFIKTLLQPSQEDFNQLKLMHFYKAVDRHRCTLLVVIVGLKVINSIVLNRLVTFIIHVILRCILVIFHLLWHFPLDLSNARIVIQTTVVPLTLSFLVEDHETNYLTHILERITHRLVQHLQSGKSEWRIDELILLQL